MRRSKEKRRWGAVIRVGIILLALSAASPAQGVNFYLSPNTTTVNVGDTFWVDIGFNNDDDVLLNGVVVTFSYDESYLELLDTDEDNLSDSGSGPGGINIMDANHFPGWDTSLEMIANRQENWMSDYPYAIHYEVMYGNNAARDGIFGRAYFKPLKVTPSPTHLVFGSYYGQPEGLYIDSTYEEIGVTGNVGASLTIIPEPGTMFLMGTGLVSLARAFSKKRQWRG